MSSNATPLPFPDAGPLKRGVYEDSYGIYAVNRSGKLICWYPKTAALQDAATACNWALMAQDPAVDISHHPASSASEPVQEGPHSYPTVTDLLAAQAPRPLRILR